jgi:mono/diheme cytochrome c family protein
MVKASYSKCKTLDMPADLLDLVSDFLNGRIHMRLRFRAWVLLPALLIPILMIAAGKGDAANGKTLFSRCSMCHGATGEGNQAIASAYGVTMPVLGSKEVQALDDAALKKVIIEGKGKMQPVKLSGAEMDDILAFVRTLKKPSAK